MATSAIIPLNRHLDEVELANDDCREDSSSGRGIPIRSISRAISVLQAINQGGALTMMEIAQSSKVPYPTACRIVQTLVHEGLIAREGPRKLYRPTALVQTLSQGFRDHGPLLDVARPMIRSLTREIGWPISISTWVGTSMVLRDSTHSQTTLTFNEYQPGYSMPILECAAGLAYLAFSDSEILQSALDQLAASEDHETRTMLELLTDGGLLKAVRMQGYAARGYNRFTRNPGKTSSLAVPILVNGAPVGCLSVAFFSTAVDINTAVRDLLPRLVNCAAGIAEQLG